MSKRLRSRKRLRVLEPGHTIYPLKAGTAELLGIEPNSGVIINEIRTHAVNGRPVVYVFASNKGIWGIYGDVFSRKPCGKPLKREDYGV